MEKREALNSFKLTYHVAENLTQCEYIDIDGEYAKHLHKDKGGILEQAFSVNGKIVYRQIESTILKLQR